MRLGVAADHGGFELKNMLASDLRAMGHEVVDFGAHQRDTTRISWCRLRLRYPGARSKEV